MSNPRSDRAENLALERRKKGLTQDELAALSGLSRSTIADLESGKEKGRPATWERVKKALKEAVDAPPGSLFPEKPERKLPEPLVAVALKGTGAWAGQFAAPVKQCGWCGQQHALGPCKR